MPDDPNYQKFELEFRQRMLTDGEVILDEFGGFIDPLEFEKMKQKDNFIEHLGMCSNEVNTWPIWKQTLLGGKEFKMPEDGVSLILKERVRQIEKEKWSSENDDRNGGLVKAAVCYALPEGSRNGTLFLGKGISINVDFKSHFWPWSAAWWKPTPDNRIKELAKAGALIAAEIDRLQRLKDKEV